MRLSDGIKNNTVCNYQMISVRITYQWYLIYVREYGMLFADIEVTATIILLVEHWNAQALFPHQRVSFNWIVFQLSVQIWVFSMLQLWALMIIRSGLSILILMFRWCCCIARVITNKFIKWLLWIYSSLFSVIFMFDLVAFTLKRIWCEQTSENNTP